VIQYLEQNSEYVFLYRNEDLNVEKRVDVDLKKASINQILDKVLEGEPVFYNVYRRQIVIQKAPGAVKSQQISVVSGEVTDIDGGPLPGVAIMVKGTTIGTITDSDGHYALQNVPGDATLLFSFVGMRVQEIQLQGRTTLNIMMEDETIGINEVVVTALGIEKEAKTLSYNVQKIEAQEIVAVKDASFINSLAGKVAGVTINSSSAGVGGASRVIMRGVKSISGNNNALYVIDGIPMPNLSAEQPEGVFAGAGQTGDGVSNINPDDIESISVLSGPSAAALYGSSASNGVVLVTTKKGQKEKLSVNLTNSTVFSSPLILPEFQQTYGQSEAGSYYSWGDKLTTASRYDPADFFQTGLNISNSLSLSTGTDKNQTYVSVSTVNSQGIIHNNDYDRYN